MRILFLNVFLVIQFDSCGWTTEGKDVLEMLKKLDVFLGLFIVLISLLTTSIASCSQTFAITSQSNSSSMLESQSITNKKIDSDKVSQTKPISELKETDRAISKTDDSFFQKSQTTQSIESQQRIPAHSESVPPDQGLTTKSVVNDIITNAKLTDAFGNPVTEVYPWSDIQINFDFSLPNNTVKQGDTTVITLPNELKFRNAQSFEIRNANGELIANAKIDPATKQVTLTYTDYAETHSDITGSFFFSAAVDDTVVKTSQDISVVVDVSGKPRPIQDIKYVKTGDSEDEKFMKYGYFDNDTGTTMAYVIRVNASGLNYTSTSVEDSLKSVGAVYDKSSFRILRGKWEMGSSGFFGLANEQDVTSQIPIHFSDDNRSFKIDFGDLQGEGYRIDYKVNTNHNPVNGELFRNSAQMNQGINIVDSRISDLIYQKAGGIGDGYNYTITLHKKDDFGNNLAGAEFEVIRDATGSSVGRITTDGSGIGKIQGLLKDSYTIKETKAPNGYEQNQNDIKISPSDFNSSKEVLREVVNKKQEAAKITIGGQKEWNDSNNQDGKRPSSIKVNLLANGTIIQSKVITSADAWKYEFTDLTKNDENGQLITYSITEDQVTDYNTRYEGYNIINTYTPGETSVGVTKSWDDWYDQDGLRPTNIQVQLYANGQIKGEPVQLNDGNRWHTTWNNLPEKLNGQDINYTVKEIDVLNGYTTTINNENIGNIIITNYHKPETRNIEGKKTWKDNNNQDGKRPEIVKVNLLANGKIINTKSVSNADNWEYSFDNLPKYENGKLITYSITEDQVPEYNTTYSDHNITNSYTPGKTSIGVTKSWDDWYDQDGLRPTNIQVQLYANGQASGDPISLNNGNNWHTVWSDLPEKIAGQIIVYKVLEVGTLSEYSTATDDTDLGNIIITNFHKPETIQINGEKTWNDANNQDGKRPETIRIHLLANGKEVDIKDISSSDNWKYSFENLPKYENGKTILYNVVEEQVPDYTTTYNGYNIVNSYTPGKTSINVTKAWDDKDNQDNIRPNSIKVQLYANGKATGLPFELNENNQWFANWTDLPEKEDGQTIKYEVKEVDVSADYSSSTSEISAGGILITNTHTPEITEVEGKKSWSDHSNQDGKRPSRIRIHLLANGQEVDTKEITVDDNWSYRFDNLPKYDRGEEINYTLFEDQVADYTTTYNGYNIINSYTPGKTSLHVNKIWNDKNNQDNLRPRNIKVQLYANGSPIEKPVELNNENNWQTMWSNLAEKRNGKTIAYSVKEINSTKGYVTTINEKNPGNVFITNSHTPETTLIEGEKKWVDNDNHEEKRPSTISVHLLADGKEIATKRVTAKDNWKYSFGSLPKNEKGRIIDYSITEDRVTDYTTTYEGYNIINKYTPGKTSVHVTKAWNDKNNQGGLRPKTIKVQLHADGKKSGAPIELNSKNQWSTTWTDLPEKKENQVILYSVTEVDKLEDYLVTINDNNLGNVIITNSHLSKARKNYKINKMNSVNESYPKAGEKKNYFLELTGIIVLITLFIVLRKKIYHQNK